MIGVAISTHHRPDTLAQALAAWAIAPPDILVVVNDDAGEGVAATKNRGIAALMDAGCEHLLLVDDDTWPLGPQAWRRYVDDESPHLMLCWGKRRLLEDDGHYATYGHPRGVAMYVQRHVVEAIGGMRTEFGRFGSEHVEWSRRIHQAGFTAAPYMDLSGSTEFWHAEDWGRPGESIAELGARRQEFTTVKRGDRRTTHRLELMEKYDGVVEFVDYRS